MLFYWFHCCFRLFHNSISRIFSPEYQTIRRIISWAWSILYCFFSRIFGNYSTMSRYGRNYCLVLPWSWQISTLKLCYYLLVFYLAVGIKALGALWVNLSIASQFRQSPGPGKESIVYFLIYVGNGAAFLLNVDLISLLYSLYSTKNLPRTWSFRYFIYWNLTFINSTLNKDIRICWSIRLWK